MGAANAGIMAGGVLAWYHALAHPPGTPPDWVFGPVWTVLYVLIGVAGWRVWRLVGGGVALRLWGWQLLLNAVWTPAFFGMHSPPLGMAVILTLLAVIVATVRRFALMDRPAAWLMLPYGIWVTYAAYLNAAFWWLNTA